MTPENFLATIKETCGSHLLSFVVYGSAAAGDAIPGKSDCNVMLVLKTAQLPVLKAVAIASAAWLKKGNPPPLVFTREQLLSSGDTFPIELTDMKAFHKVLHGEDPLVGIPVAPEHLRLALERELKSKLLLLREAYLSLGGNKKALPALMTESLSQFLVLCRAALRLRTGAAPAAKLDCAVALAAAAGFDAEIFKALHALRSGTYRGGDDAEKLFDRYLAAIDALSAAVDGWKV